MVSEGKDKSENKPDKLIYEKTPLFSKLVIIFIPSLLVFSLFFLAISLKVFLGIFFMGSFLFFLTLTLISLISKNLRPTMWLPTTLVFCTISLVIFIIAVSTPFGLPIEEIKTAEAKTSTETIAPPETTAPETTAPPETTAKEDLIEITEEDLIEITYLTKSSEILHKIVNIMEYSSQAAFDFTNGELSMEDHKLVAAEYIKDINECYDMYLKLKPLTKFETVHELKGEAMKHYLNSTTYMQSYIDSSKIEDMADAIKKATAEISKGTTYTEKATEQINELAQ